MPGKINPVSQYAYQVVGNDMTITITAETGQLELNAMEPLIAVNLLDSLNLLTNAVNISIFYVFAALKRMKNLVKNIRL